MSHPPHPTQTTPGDPAEPASGIQVTCRDALGRHRQLTVSIRGRSLVLHAPPGETAILTVREAADLVDALNDADAVLTTRTAGTATSPEELHRT